MSEEREGGARSERSERSEISARSKKGEMHKKSDWGEIALGREYRSAPRGNSQFLITDSRMLC